MKSNKLIRLSKCSLSDKTIDFVNEALSSSYLGMGEFVKRFEDKLKHYFGREVITVSSGTTALHLALESLNLKQSDEIIAPSITYLSTFQAIVAAGLKPVACDVNLNGQICQKSLKSLINENTKAIIPVHYAGNSFDIEGIYSIAKEYNLRIIEDAAHAFGSKHKNKLIGSFGDIVCFSFDGIKNITCGEGGCIITDDRELQEKIKSKRSLGVDNDYKKRFKNQRVWEPTVTTIGWRAHMSNVHAAIGLSQLEIMNKNFNARKELARYYLEKISFLNDFIDVIDISNEHVPHIFPILLRNEGRDSLRRFLSEFNIETGIHYYPCHLLDLFKTKYDLKNALYFYQNTISLPMHPNLKKDDIDFIVDKLNNFFKCKNTVI